MNRSYGAYTQNEGAKLIYKENISKAFMFGEQKFEDVLMLGTKRLRAFWYFTFHSV